MYDPQDDALFGRDMRYKPPLAPALTEEHGWGGSHGRLAFSQMNRSQESNISEYAISTLGCVPKGYVIVSESSVKYNPDTALKVCHGRVAIPVKEFARQRKLTLREQWELMNPKWVGTYFGRISEHYDRQRPSLEKAIASAKEKNRYEDFVSQFWLANDEHHAAIERLRRWMEKLQSQADEIGEKVLKLELKISKVESDIHYQRYMDYHLDGENAHELLEDLREKHSLLKSRHYEIKQKADRIREYIEGFINA